MKYNICGFDQRTLCAFVDNHKDKKQQLDCTDLVILKWIADFSVRSSVTKVIIDGNQYAWVVYNTIVDDLPFISISKRAFADRFDKLHSYGLIEKRVEKRSGMGTFLYVRVLPNYEDLLYDNNIKESHEDKEGCGSSNMGDAVQATEGGRFKQQPNEVQTADKDNTTIQENYKQNISSTIVDEPQGGLPESGEEILELEVVSKKSKKREKKKEEGEGKEYTVTHRCRLAFEQQYLQFKGEEYYYAAKDANAVKQLIDKIKTKMPDDLKENEDELVQNFTVFIQAIIHSGKVEKWVLDNLSLPIINSKFNEIYSQLKNGTAKQPNPADIHRVFGSRNIDAGILEFLT